MDRRTTPTQRRPLSASKSRTPANLNSTHLPTTSLSSRRLNSTFRANSDLNVTIARNPKIKKNLLSSDPNSKEDDNEHWDIRCNIAYSQYLQALFKKHLVDLVVAKDRQDLKDQIAIQMDKTHEMKKSLAEMEQEIKEIDKLAAIDETLGELEGKIAGFVQICDDSGLEADLEKIDDFLGNACNQIELRDIKPLMDQSEYDKVVGAMKSALISMEKKIAGRDFAGVHNLADTLRSFQEVLKHVKEQQSEISDIQDSRTFEVLETLSEHLSKAGFEFSY